MSGFSEFLAEQLQNPEVKREYDALEAEYLVKQAVVNRNALITRIVFIEMEEIMSCHRIGRALNYVQEEILEQYEAGEFDKETAQVLLLRCVETVGFCDGNSSEATETFEKAYLS